MSVLMISRMILHLLDLKISPVVPSTRNELEFHLILIDCIKWDHFQGGIYEVEIVKFSLLAKFICTFFLAYNFSLTQKIEQSRAVTIFHFAWHSSLMKLIKGGREKSCISVSKSLFVCSAVCTAGEQNKNVNILASDQST